MMVAVGVIVFLVGLTVSVSVAVANRSDRIRTETALEILEQAMAEWEASSDRQLTWWNYENPPDDPATKTLYDIHGDTVHPLILSEMLDIIMRTPSVQAIVARIEPRLIYTYEEGKHPEWIQGEPMGPQQQDARFAGSITVLDGWGWPIYATHPGRLWTPADAPQPRDADGTLHTANEARYGAATNRVIRFVSAGPDRDFGYPYTPPESPLYEATKDNLYSYPLGPAAY
jgi:hypothetical protein